MRRHFDNLLPERPRPRIGAKRGVPLNVLIARSTTFRRWDRQCQPADCSIACIRDCRSRNHHGPFGECGFYKTGTVSRTPGTRYAIPANAQFPWLDSPRTRIARPNPQTCGMVGKNCGMIGKRNCLKFPAGINSFASRQGANRAAGLCNQPRSLVHCHPLGIDLGLKNAVTLPAVPKMTNVPLIPVFGPFRSDYEIVAMGATHSKARLASGCCRGHETSSLLLPLLPRSNKIMAEAGGL